VLLSSFGHRWHQGGCCTSVMSTNALCAHTLTVSWIELMTLTPITTLNLSKEKVMQRRQFVARSEHYHIFCKLHCDYQRKYQAPIRAIRIQGHPISYPILIMILGSFDPDIGIPYIEPDIEPDIGILNMPISILIPILIPISGI
jgi:hypothetical protein